MTSNNRKPIKLFIGISIAILLCIGLIWLIDQGFNGIIKEWFYNRFIFDTDFSEDGKLGVIFGSWHETKQLIIYIFIALFAISALCISAAIYVYARRRKRQEASLIKKILNSVTADTDDISLPKEYAEIESQLLRIRSDVQKQQQLMQMEMQRKSDLITYLAHDLKTPLASVIGYLSLLDEAPDMPAEQKAKYTGIALEKAYRLETLINEFFDITRFNLNSIVLNKGKIKLAYMLQQLSDEFYPMLAPQGKQAVVDAPDDLIIIGDADKLARVFNNILKNAIAYSYDNSTIVITAAKHPDKVIITFTNEGDPIPPQKLNTIFEKFYRLDTSRSSSTGGTGLGLAIAQEIVSAHDGTITVESNIEHTSFIVTLPQ